MEYFKGLLLGMTLQLSLGPVFFAVLHKAITKNSGEALKMSFGAAAIDALYIGLSFTGVALLLQIIVAQSIVLGLGAMVLMVFGLRYLRKANQRFKKSTEGSQGTISNRHDHAARAEDSSFLYGLKITAVNPLTIVFWSGTFGALLGAGLLDSFRDALLYASGCVSATLLFLGTVSMVAPRLPFKSSKKIETGFDIIVGLVLIIFGLVMFYRLINLFIL